MIRHTIRLEGPAAHGARLSLRTLHEITDSILESAQRSLRLRVEGRSTLQDKRAWLERATDVQVVGVRDNGTVMVLDAPTLDEAAPQEAGELPFRGADSKPDEWTLIPRGDESALSVVEDALRDALSGNADSDILDRGILESALSLGAVLDQGFRRVVLNGRKDRAGPVEITPEGLRRARSLCERARAPERVVVCGWLNHLAGSRRTFSLTLPSGERVRGFLPPGDMGAWATLFARKVVVDGEARFRPSGELSMVAASHIQEAGPADAVWERVPGPRPLSVEELRPEIPPPPGSNGMEFVFGKWPGDETDEEIDSALAEIS